MRIFMKPYLQMDCEKTLKSKIYVIAFNGEIYKLRGYQVDWNRWVWLSLFPSYTN